MENRATRVTPPTESATDKTWGGGGGQRKEHGGELGGRRFVLPYAKVLNQMCA